MAKKLKPIHPGEQLREEFMLPLGLSTNALARAISMTPARINEIVRGRGERFMSSSSLMPTRGRFPVPPCARRHSAAPAGCPLAQDTDSR